MNQSSHTYYKTLIGYLLIVALLFTSALPFPAIAEETTETENPPQAAEVVEEVETESETEVVETVAEEEEVVEENSVEETESTEQETSGETNDTEESSASSEESSSESSESESSSSHSSETSHDESSAASETSETSNEYEFESTHTASTSTDTNSATNNSTSTTETSADASAGSASSTTPANDTTASTSLATNTDTAATSTATTSVDAVTDGYTTIGTTTTTHVPTDTASSSASSTTPTAPTASSTATSSSIATGAAVATANILNVVNTNLTNADGSVVFIDATGDVNETIDVRSSGGGGNATCTLSSCGSHTTHIDLDNNAEIDNTLVIAADTGNNHIDGDGSITTGAAYANANIVNVANANIVDSEYLLLTLNAFGDFNGDLVFPGLTPFLSNAKTTPAISTKDSAAIINDIVTTAVTGENSAEAGASSITTGDATTGVSLYNNINTTLANDNVSVLFRVHGDWNGTVFGLPENVLWHETGQGYLLDVTGSSTATGSNNTAVSATNTAVINNRINVAANTGGNQVLGTDEALISTGNAYAGANVVNVANANIVGQNWMLAIVNVFGDFNGNVSFGRPDVWVGGAANVPNRIKYDTPVTYTYTITNQGDAPASDITVTDFMSDHVATADIADGGVLDEETKQISWQVQDLAPGESTTVSYEAHITTPHYNVEVTNTITAELAEPDDDYVNNTEVLSFRTSKPRSSKSNVSYLKLGDGDKEKTELIDTATTSDSVPVDALELTRRPLITTVTSDEPHVTETVIITNTSNQAIPGVVFIDQLYDIENKLIHEERWDFGTVLPHEEITVSYDLSFNEVAPRSRTYSFDSVFYNGHNDKVFNHNGYINYLATTPPAEVPTEAVSFTGAQHVTSGSSSLARVLGTTTAATTPPTEVTEDDETPVVPVVASTGNNPPPNQPSLMSTIRTFVLFPLLLLALLYLMFLNRQRITINIEKLQKSYISF